MNDKLLGSDINPKATVQAKTDMTESGSFMLPDDFNIESFRPRKTENHEVSVFDGAKAFVSGSLRAIEGSAEMQNQALRSVNEKAKANDGILSSAASAVQSIPLVKAAMATTPYIKKAVDSVATVVENTFSDDAKAALSEPIVWREGDDWKASLDPAVWGIQFSKSMGYMAPTIAAALATGGASSTAALPNIVQAMIRSGANPKLAAKAAPIALNMLMKAPVVGAGMSTDLGSQGVDARKNVIDADHRQLMNSEQYQQAFIDIDSDPEYASFSDTQKFELAKEHVSDQASRATMIDARNVAASVAATMMGDMPLANAMLKGFKGGKGGLRGALGGAATGIVREAPMEAIQEGTQQRVRNEISNEFAGTNINPNLGVAEAAVSGGLMGAAMGGGMGTVGGLRSATKSETIAEPTLENTEIDADQVDVSATVDLGAESSTEKPSPTKVQSGYIKEEVVDDLNAPAYLREELRNQEGPQPQQQANIDPNDLDTPAYMRQGQAINTDPVVEPPQQTENLPAVNELEGEWLGANEQQAQPQQQAEPLTNIGHEQPPRLKGENVIYGEAPFREPINDHMEQQAAAPQFNAGEQVKGDVFMPHEQSTELQPISDVKQQVVIDGEYFTVERNGVGTKLVPSEAPPSVIYAHGNTPQQQVSLDDKQVGTPQFENGIPKNKLRQLKYLAQRISDKIPLAMQPLKGSARFTRPEYRTRLVSLADEATAMSNSKSINVQVDTVSDAITKLGGVSRASAESDGIDPAAFKRNKLFPAKDGRTFDELAELLNEHGFTSRTGGKLGANDVLDLVDSEVNNGERHFSTQSDMLTETDQGSALSDLVREYGSERVQVAISKALMGNRLGDRQAEIVNEAMDVIETGRIEQAGGIEARHAERDARRESRIVKRQKQLDQAMVDLNIPDWVTNETVAQHESEYTETLELILDAAITQASTVDLELTDSLVTAYESNRLTRSQLIEKLGEIEYADQQKLINVENTKRTAERENTRSNEERVREGQTDQQKAEGGRDRSDDSGTEKRAEQSLGVVEADDTTSNRQDESAEVEPIVAAPNSANQAKKSLRLSQSANLNINIKGMPLKQAELAVKSWLRQYNGGAGVSVKVVQTQAEAEKILGTSLGGYKVNAFYDEVSASVIVVADNIANTKELRQKLRHEILVHHGLRAVVGDTEYGRILKTVYYGLDSRFLKTLIAKVEQDYDRSNLNNFVEEVLAHIGETDRNKFQQWYDRIVAAIAQALRKVGLMTPSDITKAELNNIVQTLTDRIKSVNEWGPDNTPPNSGSNGHLSRTKFSRTTNNDNTSAFQSAVDQARTKLSSKMNGPIADVSDAGFDIPTDNLKSTIARKLADKFQVLKELQKNIVKSGGNINEDNDAYLAEELFHGKAENDLRIMKDAFVKPLADKMAKHGISQAQLDEYLIARHAQERNDYIASINPKFPDGGSGMKNADAQAKLDEIRNGGKQQKYDELAHIVDAMITKQRDVLRDSGLETDEMIDTWQSHYKHYVPLKGIAKDESSLPRTGKGFAIGGKEAKNAMGRKSMAESPSGHAIIDLTEKLIRARKNEVGQSLLKLVQDNPSNDYWQVFTNDNPDTAPQIVERKNPLTGEKEKIVEDRAVPMAMMSDYYFSTKKNGKVYYIKLHDQRLMNAMKNMGPDTSNGIIRFMATFNRYLASVNTSYNPEFVIGNFARDIQTAFLNLSAEQTRDDGKIKGANIAKQVIVDIKKAMPAVYASLRNKQSKSKEGREWQQYFEDFMSDGGKTGWFDMKDIDGQAKDLERMVEMASGSVKGKAYKGLETVKNFVENANGAIENAVRLSAYVNARKAGISRKKSSSLAKNMTVNFNRRGEVGTTMNALYMFANASIQGSANFIRTMTGLNGDGKLKWENLNKAQKLAVGIVAGSFALAFANRNAAGEDEDGVNWFDKVPDYIKERNFVIMKSLTGGEQDGSYWTIPMPYGYNIFSVLGASVETSVNSDYITPAQAAVSMAMATLGSFSPLGVSRSETVSGTILKNALPTMGKPLLEHSLNENFHGGQIYQENFPFGAQMPDSSMGKRSTGEHYKVVAEWLNESTGGSQFRSGAIDFSPDSMKYIVGYLGGAALRFTLDKVPGAIEKGSGEDVPDNKVAFLSRISGKVMPYADQSQFYDRRDELMQIKDESKVTFGAERSEFMTEHGHKLRLLPLLKVIEKQLKVLRQRRNVIYALDIPIKDKDLRLKNIEREMMKVIDRFNKTYNE